MVLNVGIISFFSVVLFLVFGTYVCKTVLVWPVLMFGRMCYLRVATIGKRKPCWAFYVGSFSVLLSIIFGELEMKFGFLVILNLRSRFLN
jgi:hypothetical protein